MDNAFARTTATLFVTLLLFCTCVGAHAQLSVPNALTSQFDQTDAATSIPSGVGLTSARISRPAAKSYATLGYTDELTVRTDETGHGRIDDFHANGRYAIVGYRTGDGPNAPMVTAVDTSEATTDYTNEGHTLIAASGNLNRRLVSWVRPLPGQSAITLTYARQDYTAGGSTNLYNNTFGFFPSTPPFQLQKEFNLGSVDYLMPFRRGWQAEATLARTESPGRIFIQEPGSPSFLSLPLSDSGDELIASITRQLNRHGRLVLFRGRGSWAGRGDIDREDNRMIGTGESRRGQDDAGIGWLLTSSPSRRYTLFYETRHDTWQTNGIVPNGSNLDLGIPLVNIVQYAAAYDLRSTFVGFDAVHDLGHGRTFDFGYRYIAVRPWLGASYNARITVFGASGSTSTGGQWLKGHELNLRYTSQFGSWLFGIGVHQVIPIVNHNGSGSSLGSIGSSGGSGSTKSSDGGRLLQFDITREF